MSLGVSSTPIHILQTIHFLLVSKSRNFTFSCVDMHPIIPTRLAKGRLPMFWSRTKSKSPKSVRSVSARPGLETLEDRCTPSVSPVFDGAGNLFHFLVRQDGALLSIAPNGTATTLINSGVRTAHGFRDTAGGIGLVYTTTNGDGFFFQQGTTTSLGTGNVLDAGFAYAKDGSFRLDIIYVTGSPPFGPDLTGNLVEFTKTGSTTLATNARWVNAYEAVGGGTGIAFGLIASSGNLQCFVNDASRSMLKIYDSPDGATQDLTDYCQTINSSGAVVAAITHGRFAGTYALEFGPTGVTTLGNGADILVGG